MKKFFAEFKEFAIRGNVMDLAIGVIIGAAFKAIVDSLVNDILSPFIGLLVRQNLAELSGTILGVEVKYGAFITAIINFIIMTFVIFLIVKSINALSKLSKKEEEEEEEATTKECPFCCSEIPKDATRCPHCTSALEE